jgi:hypothetical protein
MEPTLNGLFYLMKDSWNPVVFCGTVGLMPKDMANWVNKNRATW